MDRLLGVLVGSLFTSGVAFAYPLQAPTTPATPLTVRPEIRHEVPFGGPVLGVQATELTPELQEFFGTDGLGVLISRVFDDTAADEAGVEVGDILVAIDGEPVSSIWELRAAVDRAAGDDVLVEVVRDGQLIALDAGLAVMAPPEFDAPSMPSDEDVWRRSDDRDEYVLMERQYEDLQERLRAELDDIHDRLDALEERGLGTGRVK